MRAAPLQRASLWRGGTIVGRVFEGEHRDWGRLSTERLIEGDGVLIFHIRGHEGNGYTRGGGFSTQRVDQEPLLNPGVLRITRAFSGTPRTTTAAKPPP